MAKSATVTEITISPVFKLVFLTVTGLTLLSIITSILMCVFIDNPSGIQLDLITTCSGTWKMGFAAILGLIGGKAT